MDPRDPRPANRTGGPTADDLRWLGRAHALARRGWGQVHPNPMVGCVIVRDGELVAEGWHARFGGPHAEVHALERAGEAARGATVYVTLEPCGHQGKTPPCSRALLEAGVARVVYAAADPGAGAGGAAALARAGVEVVGPAEPPERARRTDPAFFHWAEHGTPWIALKLAVSLDGAIAAAPGERTALSGPEAHAWVHDLRAGFDAVLVGAGTARTDDPLLTARGEIRPRVPPRRVVLDPSASLPPGARMLTEAEPSEVLVLAGPDAPAARLRALEAAGAEVAVVARGEGGLDLDAVTRALAERDVRSVLVEGGARVATSLLREDRAHRLHLLVAPRALGPSAVQAFTEPLDLAVRGWEGGEPPRTLGRDVLLTYERAVPSAGGGRPAAATAADATAVGQG
ncbi:MAG: bifunctional diaminohydroxyphosphoribosylaminopyrimidine deaminase/5-amino-6-(5-phosphoribosylamino)uracil reductase RibD [Gemmatimonadetes bacterium]|nr:MAG: bifunctional diaminohydroxyphosphoribosylaminopyrimidine deaminase/5-amino-6-(5-phosphoribosylamino)uracil reductase RibD [Gemmatimonadota bacterium]